MRFRITGPLGHFEIDDTRDLALLREALAMIDHLRVFARTPALSVQMDSIRVETIAEPARPDRQR